eukprot:TRINITY_DN29412_c0_g1_i1.p1 TRINITY_DN29412_c0_g1~~TRINITY_DN29412_c0_g1_i1.p1  ORF type:complete len:783 (+),score=183.02 TRINITY_DN29412_c0_g1_i1:210-2351(+)
MESALGKQRMVMHKMVQGFHETAMKFISKKEEQLRHAGLEARRLQALVVVLQKQVLKHQQEESREDDLAEVARVTSPMSAAKAMSRPTSAKSAGSALAASLLREQLGASERALAEREASCRQFEAENFELREQLAAIQAVGAAYTNINSRNLGDMQRVSTPLERGIRPPSGASRSVPVSSAPILLQSSNDLPITTGGSVTAFFDMLDKAQGEPLDRLDRAQAKLDAWASNHHPKPNPILAGMMDFNTQALPDIPGTVNEWTSELDQDDSSGDAPDKAQPKDAAEDEDEEDEEDALWSFVRPGKHGAKKKKNEGGKALGMKNKVFDALGWKGTTSSSQYKTKGIAQKIVRSTTFATVSIFLIFTNAIWIGIDTSYNYADTLYYADVPFIIIEQFFCSFFVFEIVVRFVAFRRACSALLDAWWLFDFILVCIMVLETWILFTVTAMLDRRTGEVFDTSILRMLRLIRLTRVARIARLLRLFPEVMVLLKALMVAARSVFFTVLLLAVIVYVFAIAFVQLSNGTTLGSKYFTDDNNLPSISAGMFSLVVHGCLYSNLSDFAVMCFKEHVLFGMALVLFLVVGPWTVMNMLVGVLVQVVDIVAAAEEDMATRRLVIDQLMEAMVQLDENGDEMLSQDEFTGLLQMPDVISVFNEADIDVVALAKDPDIVFAGEQELSFKDFFAEVLLLRGSNTATVKDIVQLRKQLHKELRKALLGR